MLLTQLGGCVSAATFTLITRFFPAALT